MTLAVCGAAGFGSQYATLVAVFKDSAVTFALTQNIELNRELIAASGGRAEPARLVWGDAADTAALEEPGGFDLVVGSDVLHLSEWHDELRLPEEGS